MPDGADVSMAMLSDEEASAMWSEVHPLARRRAARQRAVRAALATVWRRDAAPVLTIRCSGERGPKSACGRVLASVYATDSGWLFAAHVHPLEIDDEDQWWPLVDYEIALALERDGGASHAMRYVSSALSE